MAASVARTGSLRSSIHQSRAAPSFAVAVIICHMPTAAAREYHGYCIRSDSARYVRSPRRPLPALRANIGSYRVPGSATHKWRARALETLQIELDALCVS